MNDADPAIKLSQETPEEIERLAEIFAAHLGERSGEAEPTERRIALQRAVSATLILGPQELGIEYAAGPNSIPETAALASLQPEELPEAQVCSLWLACARQQAPPEAVDLFIALTAERLWEPVQALAFRALAWFGRRQALGHLLAKDGVLSLIQADAWLESSLTESDLANLADRLSSSEEPWLPADTSHRWRQLLRAEMDLNTDTPVDSVEASLSALAVPDRVAPPRTLTEAVQQRLAARATAALARHRLGHSQSLEEVLARPSAKLLPAWEREYLLGLGRWQRGACAEAASALRTSLQLNPHQTATRVALATLRAETAAQEALALLEHPEPTRELLLARAIILSRNGRHDAARQCLAEDAGKLRPGGEAARMSWSRGQEQYRHQEEILRSALAESGGQWAAAERSWQGASARGMRRTLAEARRLFAAARELESLGTGHSWRRDQLDQRVRRGLHELGAVPLASNELFFRAAAALGAAPDRAARDFAVLLQRRAWVEAERRAGGARLAFIGDALLRLGRVAEAIAAYESAATASASSVTERLAMARVYAELLRCGTAQELAQVAEDAMQLAPASPWPPTLAALGLLVAGAADLAKARVEKAIERGAPEPLCRLLGALCSAGRAGTNLSPQDFATLRLPNEAAAAVRLMFGEGPEPQRIEALARTLGDRWLALCPIDPESAVRRLIALLWPAGNREAIQRQIEVLTRSGLSWAGDLAALARLRLALELAERGELEKAETELQTLAGIPGSSTA